MGHVALYQGVSEFDDDIHARPLPHKNEGATAKERTWFEAKFVSRRFDPRGSSIFLAGTKR
jgi:hypothetical protein